MLAGVTLLLLTPPLSWGNIGPPSSGGQIVAEPIGIQDVEIAHETLSIDLRPLANGEQVQVKVVYNLINHGAEKTLDLLFVSGAAGVNNFHVRLGDQTISSHPAADAPIPASWQAPKETPSLQDDQKLSYLAYGSQSPVPHAFSVVIPSGQQVLTVQYQAEAATHRYGNPTVYRQFAYVLAPARSWSAFGGLDVTIQLPRDWRAVSTPALSRIDDKLTGSFKEIPADAIALTLQAPAGWAYRVVSDVSIWLFVLTIVAAMVLCWRIGLVSGRRLATSSSGIRNSRTRAWPLSLAAATMSGIAVFGTGILAINAPDAMLPAGQVNHYGYGQIFAFMGVLMGSMLLVPLCFAICQITASSFKQER